MFDQRLLRVGLARSVLASLVTALAGAGAPAQAPRLVLDAAPGAIGSMAAAPFAIAPSSRAGEVFLVLDDGVHGAELWRSDGSPSGTTLVVDLTPAGGTTFGLLQAQFDGLWFVVYPWAGPELWRSDGTAAGTVRLLDAVTLGATNLSGPLFRFADGDFVIDLDGVLARSDGTANGTHTLGVPNGAIYDAGGGSLWVFDTTPPRQLWSSDGTSASGTLVASGLGNVVPALGGLLVTQATPSGGTVLQVLGVTPTPQATLPEDVLVVARDHFVIALGSTRLWSWNGQSTPVLLGTFATAYDPFPYGGFFAFARDGHSMLFFPDDGVHGHEPWWSDGTPTGTRLLTDLTPGPASTTVWPGFTVEDRIVFWAVTPNLGSEPWTTDGTPAGTTLLGDLEPGIGGSTVDAFAGTGGVGWRRVVLPIATSAVGNELWVSDGTAAGTRLLADANPGPASSIQPFSYWSWNAGSSLLVALDDGTHGIEPHAVDFDAVASWLLGGCSARDRYLVRDPVLGAPWRLDAHDVAIGGVALLAQPATTPLRFGADCAVQLDVATSVVLTAITPDAIGDWTASLALPGAASLVGARVVTQAAFLDPARPSGFVVADAWFATLGF